MILFLHLHRLKGTTVCVRVTFNRDGKFHPTIDVWIWLRAFFTLPTQWPISEAVLKSNYEVLKTNRSFAPLSIYTIAKDELADAYLED